MQSQSLHQKKNQTYRLLSSALLIVGIVFGNANLARSQGLSLPAGGRMSLHGMVLFGGGPYFIDHIPMLMNPHDFQVITEVTLRDAHGGIITKDFANGTFTLKPSSNFSLNDFINGQLRHFSGAIYQGGFEQGGQIISGLSNVQVEIRKIHLARQLPADSKDVSFKVSDQRHSFQINIITPKRNFQSIKNESSPLWCVVGPDFSNFCPTGFVTP